MTASSLSLAVLALIVVACTSAVNPPGAPAAAGSGASAPPASATASAAAAARPSSPAATGTTPAPATTDGPSPTGPIVATIRTKDSPLGGCGAAEPQPFLLRGDPAGNDEGEQVWLEPHLGGGQLAAIFPYGFSARFEPQLVLRDGDGVVVARAGDTLELAGAGDPMAMCGIASVNGQPTPRASFGLPPSGTGTAIIATCDDQGTGIGPFRIEFLARDRPQGDPLRYFEIEGFDEDCAPQTYELPAGRWDFRITSQDRTIDSSEGGRFELLPATSIERSLVFHRLVPGDGIGELLLVVCSDDEGQPIPYTLDMYPLEGQAPDPLTFDGTPGCRPVMHTLASGQWRVVASSPGFESDDRVIWITKDETERAAMPLRPCYIAGCPTLGPSPP